MMFGGGGTSKVGENVSGSNVPWYQQPTYTGTGFAGGAGVVLGGLPFLLSGSRPNPVGMAAGTSVPSQQTSDTGASMDVFYCDPCEKEFGQESQYKAHIATHVNCTVPGCAFVGSQRVVKEHVQMAHGDGRFGGGKGGKDGNPAGATTSVSMDTPEEIARWREARARNWPSDANIQRKKEAQQQRQSRGQPVPQPARGGKHQQRGPAWKLKPSINQDQQSPHAGQRNSGIGMAEPNLLKRESKAATTPVDKHDNAATSTEEIATAVSNPLVGLDCYDSSGSDQEPESIPANCPPNVTNKPSEGPNANGSTIARMPATQGHTPGRSVDQHNSNNKNNINRGKQKGRGEGRGGAANGYVSHGEIERKGGSLLAKLLKEDTGQQDAILLQAIRFLVSSNMVDE